jgi:phenylacetate-CoA ligase
VIREFLAKRVGFPLQDRIMHTDISGTLKFLRESQYWDRNRLDEYRLTKLKQLIEYAFNHIPYYGRLYKSAGLNPGDIKTLDDIKKIPVLTKEIMREEGINLLDPASDMKYVKTGKTGGTTGVPVMVYKDTRSRSFTWASYYRWYEWMGLEVGDRTCTLWGARSVLSLSRAKKLRDTFRNFLQNKIDINSFNMNDNDLRRIYEKILRFKPKIIKGYTSALLLLAGYIEKNSFSNINPLAVSTTSEMLLPHERVFLEKVFKAPDYYQYGCGEVSAITNE